MTQMRLPKCIDFCVFWLVLGGAVSTGPQITSPLQNVVVAMGGSASLPCSTTGSPQPAVSWYKVGGTLPSGRNSVASNGTLKITALLQSDAGQYYCVATNTAGSVRSLNSSVVVAYMNTVSSTLASQTLNLNDYLVLQCAIPTSIPSASVAWTSSSGGTLSYNSRVGVTLSGLLVYSFLMGGDTATLTCTVSNSIAGVSQVSSQYSIVVTSTVSRNIQNALFITTPLNQTVLVGAVVMFDCFAVGVPIPTISWFKDGTALPSSPRITYLQSNKILVISNVTTGDGGAYSCTALQQTNNGFSITSAGGQLTVLVPPTITQSFQATQQYASLSSTLTCYATGTAPLMWAWLSNGTVVSNSSRVQYNGLGTQSTLTFTSVQASDSGVYQCLVYNPLSGAAAANEVFVGITLAPVISQAPPTNIFNFTGSYIQLPCIASGYPPPTFQWTKGGGVLQADSSHIISTGTNNGTLTITSTMASDSANYLCTATNMAGSAVTPTTFLRVIAYPTIINITQTPATPPNAGTPLTLWCTIQPYPQLTSPTYSMAWYKDGATFYQASGLVASCTFGALSTSNNGYYECYATIQDTSGLSLTTRLGSVTLTVGAPLTAPSEPLNLTSSLINSTSFYLQWSIPASSGGIAIRNYTVQLYDLGNTLGCNPSQQGWVPMQQGVVVLGAWVTGLKPFSSYQARVVAYNSVKGGNASVEIGIMTLTDVPSAPPTSVSATAYSKSMMLTWQSPSPCTMNAVPLGYSILLSGAISRTYQTNTTSTTYSISSLQPNQAYTVQVAIYTAMGTGPFSAPLSVATPEVLIPGPPTNLVAVVSGPTSVQLTWGPPAEGRPPTSYMVMYYQIGSPVQITVTVPSSQQYSTVMGLVGGGSYNISVFASNSYGSGDSAFVKVIIPLSTNLPATSIFQATWFLPAVAGGGGAVVLVVLIIIISCCCCCCYGYHRRLKVTLNDTAGSGSPAMSSSSGFTEFQRPNHSKKKPKPTVLNGIMHIHDSPTPSRRSTDYADPHYIQSQSAITASSAQYGSSHLPINASMSTLPPPPQYDGSLYDQRRHAISPPCVEPPYMFREPASTSSQLTQDSDETWAPASSLNRRGHMTSDTGIDRHGHNDSFRSANSASANSSADEKPPAANAMHLPTLQETPQQANGFTAEDTRPRVLSQQGDSSRTWNGKQMLSSQTRSNSKTLLHHGLEHSQRLQPPQPMPSFGFRSSDFKTSDGLVLPPPPPMDDTYPSGSDTADRPAKGVQSKSSTLSSTSTSNSTPKKVDLGQLTKLNTANSAGAAPAVNQQHLWQPQLLTKRNLEYSLKQYASNELSDMDDRADAASLASTYV